MAIVWKFIRTFFVLLVVGFISWGVITYWSVIFSKTVVGEITAVERVEIPLMMARSNFINDKVFSFAVGIKDAATGQIFTASSEDRQWAVAHPGQCAEAVFLPYPPWEFTKRGTFHGARLVKLYECPPK